MKSAFYVAYVFIITFGCILQQLQPLLSTSKQSQGHAMEFPSPRGGGMYESSAEQVYKHDHYQNSQQRAQRGKTKKQLKKEDYWSFKETTI